MKRRTNFLELSETHFLYKEVKCILTQDMICRRERKWPLIKHNKFYSNGLEIPFKPKCITEANNFIGLQEILTKWKGKIVLAGGSVLLPKLHYLQKDVDIFFYGITETEATDILLDCIEIIVRRNVEHYYDPNKRGLFSEFNVRIEKKEKVVNVIIDNYEVFQFILRIYPTRDSIIGSFDIPLSMALYDGDDIYVTPLAHFCMNNEMIIVDLSRRSTTFEYRLAKYQRRFRYHLYLPGLDINKMIAENNNNNSKNLQLLQKFLRDNEIIMHSHEEIKVHSGKSRLGNIAKIDLVNNRTTSPRVQLDLDKEVDESLIKRYSDYEHSVIFSECIPKANGTMLRCNNLENLIQYVDVILTRQDSIEELTFYIEDLIKRFKFLIKCPVIEYKNCPNGEHYYPESNIARIKSYGDSLPLRKKFLNEEIDHNELREILDQKCRERHQKAISMSKGIKWNTFTPGQQWTSSYNPIVEDVRKWYSFYNGYTIGIPKQVENILRLGRLDHNCVFSMLNKDVFRKILRYLVEFYADSSEIPNMKDSFNNDIVVSSNGKRILSL